MAGDVQELPTMTAVRLDEFGPPDVMRAQTVRRPRPGPGEVLVAVRAAGVNPVDLVTRRGDGYLRTAPLVLGWDVAGTVAELGGGVTRFRPGDEVFGMVGFPAEGAAYAQFVTAPSRQLVAAPGGSTPTDLAALAMPALTSWQVLDSVLRVGPGDRIAVAGVSGAVGSAAVQLAATRGASVTAIAGRERHATLVDLPPACVLVATEDLDTVDGEFTAVFDPVRAISGTWLEGHVGPSGRVVAFGGGPRLAGRGDITVQTVLVEPDRHDLEQVAERVGQGLLRPVPYRTYPLAEAGRAHADLEQRRIGKAVLTT